MGTPLSTHQKHREGFMKIMSRKSPSERKNCVGCVQNSWIVKDVNPKSNDETETPKEVVSRGTNTEPTALSLEKWHGAEWQCKLPRMYLPRTTHRNSNESVFVRSKTVQSRWRDSKEMPGAGERGK